jgi:hypothetical protein
MLHISPSPSRRVEGATVEPTAEFAQLQLSFVDQIQWRYEVIRPLVLLADRTATQRAQETHTHPETGVAADLLYGFGHLILQNLSPQHPTGPIFSYNTCGPRTLDMSGSCSALSLELDPLSTPLGHTHRHLGGSLAQSSHNRGIDASELLYNERSPPSVTPESRGPRRRLLKAILTTERRVGRGQSLKRTLATRLVSLVVWP